MSNFIQKFKSCLNIKKLFRKKTLEEKDAKELKFQKSMQKYLDDTSPTNRYPVLKCSNFTALRLVWHYMAPVSFFIITSIAMIFAGSGIDGYLIYNIKFIVNQGGGVLNKQALISFSYLLMIMMTIRAFMMFLSQVFLTKSSSLLDVSVGEKMFSHISKMPQAFFDIHGHGTIISKIQFEVGGLTSISGGVLLGLSRNLSTVFAFLMVMFQANWVLSSIVFLLLPVIYFTLKFVRAAVEAMARNNISGSSNQIVLLNEMVKGHQVVNLYNAQKFEHKRYYETVDNNRILSDKGVVMANLGHTFIQLVASLILAALIFLAAYANDLHIPKISPGDFIVIFTSMFGLLKPLRMTTTVFASFIESLTGAKSVLGILALDTEEDKGTQGEDVNFSSNIEFRNVTFHYPTRPEQAVLENFNLTIEAGKTYALVGKSGGGKSTIVSLLPRIYNVDDVVDENGNHIINSPDSGIFIDGVNIRDIKLDILRDHISVVSQNVHLFDDTIYNNIVYCDKDKYTEEEVMEAARLAHVLDFTNDLPDGIETLIGSDGTRLSGGQRQRVSIARALLRQKPILILDEATSALDNESEYFIQHSLVELQKGKTVLVIAHRLSTIENSDQILVIKGGKIIERGTHSELVQHTGGEYYKLYTRDFEE